MLAASLGSKAMPNVVIATTMWSKVSENEGRKREDELKDMFWKEMMSNGCKTKRFKDTFDSAWDIVGMNLCTHHADRREVVTSSLITISKKAVHQALLR